METLAALLKADDDPASNKESADILAHAQTATSVVVPVEFEYLQRALGFTQR